MTTGGYPNGDGRNRVFAFTAEAVSAGVRLDQFLAHHLPTLSRSQIAAAIRQGKVTVGGKRVKNSYRLRQGDPVRGTIEGEKVLDVKAQQIDFPVLFEDETLLVISKPPGLVVHPGSGNKDGTLVNGLLHYCTGLGEVGDSARPGIVHRLDKDTSGVMVIAKNNVAHRELVSAFKEHRLEKQYLALVHGAVPAESGTIDQPIGRHPVHRQKMAIVQERGRHALSHWRCAERFGGRYTLLEVRIETGRTHQIRVHLAHLGCPVAGDQVYGGGRDNALFPRQMLHAQRLALRHPLSGVEMVIAAPLWPDFQNVLDDLRAEG